MLLTMEKRVKKKGDDQIFKVFLNGKCLHSFQMSSEKSLISILYSSFMPMWNTSYVDQLTFFQNFCYKKQH